MTAGARYLDRMVARASGRVRPGLRPRPTARFEPGDAIHTTVEGDAEGTRPPHPAQSRPAPVVPPPQPARVEARPTKRAPVATAESDGPAPRAVADPENAYPTRAEPGDATPLRVGHVTAELTVAAADAPAGTVHVDRPPDGTS